MAVATKPRYSPRTPPSSLITFNVIPRIVSSDAVKVVDRIENVDGVVWDDVWYAEASACFDDVTPADDCFDGLGINAVAMDKRERTRSNGYVEPFEVNKREISRRG